jgi:ribonucleoside-triphosphate reductase
LHRVALVARDTGIPFNSVLNEHLQSAERLLTTHKEILKERVDSGFLKFFNIGWEDINMFFSTIGYTGLIDAYSVCTGISIKDIVEDPELLSTYVEFASKTLDYMDDFATAAGARTESSAYNVEEIPAENASPKLAQADNFLYSDRDWYESTELLSNQMIPLYYDVPLMRRLEISGLLMNKVSGGSILHLNLTEQVTDEAYIELVEKMIEEYHIPHFAINVGTSICEDGHATPGIFQVCPECDKEIVDWNIRVVGFNTDVSSWSPERREEFKRRQFYGASDVTAKNIL